MFRTFFYACWLALLLPLIPAESRSMTASETGHSKTAQVYLNPNTGRFWMSDSYDGDNEDPLSLHKYLYAEANPINMMDPTGLASTSLTAAAIGREVHRIIGADFVRQLKRFGITGPSIGSILGLPGQTTTSLPGKIQKNISRLFPDLVDLKDKSIFEIKPVTIGGTAAAAIQLGGYILALNEFDPVGNWHAGTAAEYYYPPEPFMISNPPAVVMVFPPVFGIIYYETLQQFVQTEVKTVAAADEAEADDSVGIDSLTSLILF